MHEHWRKCVYQCWKPLLCIRSCGSAVHTSNEFYPTLVTGPHVCSTGSGGRGRKWSEGVAETSNQHESIAADAKPSIAAHHNYITCSI